MQVLDPKRAAEATLARLAEPNLDERTGGALLEAAAAIPSLEAGWGLLRLAENSKSNAALRRAALDKVVANLDRRGAWSEMARDEKLTATLKRLLAEGETRAAALAAVGSLHLARLSGDVLAIAASKDFDAPTRVAAIEVAADLKPPNIAAALRALLDDSDPAVRDAALRAVVDVQDARTLREVLSSDRFSPSARAAAVERLVDSAGGALVLLRLIDEDQLPADLKQLAIAKAAAHADLNVRVLYEKFIPADERPKKLGGGVAADQILALSGDVARGREIFNKSSAAQCKKCHAVQGFGGTLGPDLTKIGKKYERKTLLETIIEPSKAIAPEFVPYLLETTDGKIYAGFIVERSDSQVVLKDINAHTIRVKTADVESLVRQEKSLMPELILSEVTAQDAADLLAFLTTLQ